MRCIQLGSRLLAIAAFGTFLTACNGNSGLTTTAPALPAANAPPAANAAPPHPPELAAMTRAHGSAASGKIKHVIIIVQENRSFNNLFYKFPGATTATYGYTHTGEKVTLNPIGLETTWDLDHSSASFFDACNGTGSFPGTDCQMNGFDKEYAGCGHYRQQACPYPNPQYAYVPHYETKPYFDMGDQYVLADQMYASNFDASSFISHQYIISGQAESAVNYPGGDWGCPGGSGDRISMVTQQRQINGYEVVCWDPTTLGDELDGARISWGFYTATINGDGNIWSAYQAIKHIYYGPDWNKDIITPQTNFFNDVSHGRLRAVNWITPTCENSDHAGCGRNTGPQWVASLVNAVGQSKYWKSTAIFIMWDDYGGWFDPEPPALLDYDGLGLRIPMLIVSPYAKKGYVSHTHYEHGSILRFIENLFGLGQLAASDARATPPDDAFNFNKPPRKFKVIPTTLGKEYFMHQPLDTRWPDTQ